MINVSNDILLVQYTCMCTHTYVYILGGPKVRLQLIYIYYVDNNPTFGPPCIYTQDIYSYERENSHLIIANRCIMFCYNSTIFNFGHYCKD